MKPKSEPLKNPPEAVRGLKHVLAATRYSLGGFVCLMKEPAFVLELLGCVFLFILFWIVGAKAGQFLGLALLCLAVFGVEALNTAIELIVDEISPHRSEFAQRTKDIGSFAVFCILSATGLYSAWVLFFHL